MIKVETKASKIKMMKRWEDLLVQRCVSWLHTTRERQGEEVKRYYAMIKLEVEKRSEPASSSW
jgi:hypothetical protein